MERPQTSQSVFNWHDGVYDSSHRTQAAPLETSSRALSDATYFGETCRPRTVSGGQGGSTNPLRASRWGAEYQSSGTQQVQAHALVEEKKGSRIRAMWEYLEHKYHKPRQSSHQATGRSQQSQPSRWIRRAKSLALHRSSRLVQPSRLQPREYRPDAATAWQWAGQGINTQVATLNPRGGEAARAAAAAQNEILESVRPRGSKKTPDFGESGAENDSESGIGIDLRDRNGSFTLSGIDMNRIDPAIGLPEEIFTAVLSCLDAPSLMLAELVSRRWRRFGNDYMVWRSIFLREFGLQQPAHCPSAHVLHSGGLGLGKRSSAQDWKRMWRVRRALHDRWSNGHAGAIYLEGHLDTVYCVQFDERKIITGSRDRTMRVWDARTYKCTKVIGIPKPVAVNQPPAPVLIRPGKGHRPFASIYPAQANDLLPIEETPAPLHTGSILCLQFDAQFMVTGSSDMTLIAWDIASGYKPIRQHRQHTGGVLDVCFDSNVIVSCSKDTTICLWARRTGELLHILTGHRGPVNAVQLRGGELLVSASGDGVAKLWNIASGRCIKEFPSRDRGLACVEFSHDLRTIFAGGNDQVVYQFDANTGELARELRGHSNLVRSLHLDAINSRIISGSYDYSVKVYDAGTGRILCDFAGWTTSWILSAKSDYRRIVATSQDRRVVIMDFGFNLPGIEVLEE